MNMSGEQIRRFMENTAARKGWHLTPDEELKGFLVEGFEVNVSRYGYLQCPCRDSWGEHDRDADIICPCSYAQADIEEFGQCFCGLYLDETTAARGTAGSIPERRPEEKFPR